jgi:hypothetical protein
MSGRISGVLGLFAAAMVFVAGCSSGTADRPAADSAVTPAAAGPAYTPVVSLNEMMVYVVDPHANEIWDAATRPPTTDTEWAQLNRAAIAMAAAGSLTKMSGNGANDRQWLEQADWTRHSQALSDAGLAAVAAVRAKDAAAVSKAGDQLVLTCINCHREYRLNVPQIWTERQLPPEERK